MKLKVLPNELLIMIYKFSDNHTRLNMNKLFFQFEVIWNECGFMKYLPKKFNELKI